jgi:hypothetical protein
MQSRSDIGHSRTAIILILVVILVVGIILAIIVTRPASPKTFEVTGVSLNPSEMLSAPNSYATLSFSIMNYDTSKSHQVRVEFNVPSQVILRSGNIPLQVGTDGLQYYPIEIQASTTSTLISLNVTATLTPYNLTSTYPIQFSFYDENNTKFDSETVNLKVNTIVFLVLHFPHISKRIKAL